MSRFLTPWKTGLLALITLYVDSVIPTGATVSILSFIIASILPARGATVPEDTEPNSISANSLEDLRKATIAHASGIPGRTIWDLLLNKLWEISSFDALHVFFDSLPSLLPTSRDELQREKENSLRVGSNKSRLSRVSPLGTFVRRAHLEFTRLQLHDGLALWKRFATYREPTRSAWRRRNPDVGKTNVDANLPYGPLVIQGSVHHILYGELDSVEQQSSGISTAEVERLLEFQVDQMQRVGNRMPDDMKRRYEDMVQAGVTIPSLSHYVRFLDSWKTGDYPSAFDNLHRYFDYTMHNRDRTFYQYALLNLAILQADFGCFSEAIAAIQETIATARENKDMGCLNYSLSWLYHFGKAHPEEIGEVQNSGVLGTDKEALAFLRAKAKETSMWSLLSMSLLSEAKLALIHGESLSSALENITKASHLNVMKNIPNAIGSQMMMRSSLFSRLGICYSSWSQNELFLECYAHESPSEDALHFLCKSACATAIRGRHELALDTMEGVSHQTLRTLKHQQYWEAYNGLIKLQNCLHRNDLVAAEYFLSQLRADPAPNHDIAYSSAVLEIDFQLRHGNYSSAIMLLERESVRLSGNETDIFELVKVMTLKARVYDKMGTPQKGFSVAARAASLAYQAHILPALWEAIGALCKVLISLREFEAAATTLQGVMPQVLECEDWEMTSNSFSTLADAHMGMAGAAGAELLKRKEQISKAIDYVDRAFDGYSRIGDVKCQCEMMAKKATIMYLSGDLMLVNDYAAKYLDIQKASRKNVSPLN